MSLKDNQVVSLILILSLTSVLLCGCAVISKNKPVRYIIAGTSMALGALAIGVASQASVDNRPATTGSILLGTAGVVTGSLPMFAPYENRVDEAWLLGLAGISISLTGAIIGLCRGTPDDELGNAGNTCTTGCKCGNSCIDCSYTCHL